MRKILYRIKCVSVTEPLLPMKEKQFLFFDKVVMKRAEYIYWLEYRIDQNRFWYGELKPVIQDDGTYAMKLHQHITKRPKMKDSIAIIKKIAERAKENGFQVFVTDDSGEEYNYLRGVPIEQEEQEAIDDDEDEILDEEVCSEDEHHPKLSGLFLKGK